MPFINFDKKGFLISIILVYMHQIPVLSITTSVFVTTGVLSKDGGLNHFEISISRLGYVCKSDFSNRLFLFEAEPHLLVVLVICMV